MTPKPKDESSLGAAFLTEALDASARKWPDEEAHVTSAFLSKLRCYGLLTTDWATHFIPEHVPLESRKGIVGNVITKLVNEKLIRATGRQFSSTRAISHCGIVKEYEIVEPAAVDAVLIAAHNAARFSVRDDFPLFPDEADP